MNTVDIDEHVRGLDDFHRAIWERSFGGPHHYAATLTDGVVVVYGSYETSLSRVFAKMTADGFDVTTLIHLGQPVKPAFGPEDWQQFKAEHNTVTEQNGDPRS